MHARVGLGLWRHFKATSAGGMAVIRRPSVGRPVQFNATSLGAMRMTTVNRPVQLNQSSWVGSVGMAVAAVVAVSLANAVEAEPHGDPVSVITMPNGSTYIGQVQNEEWHGQVKLTSPDGPILTCKFKSNQPFLSEAERIAQLSSTLFASLLAGTNTTGATPPYSLQIVSQYLSGMSDAPLKAMGLELKFAAELAFLDPESAKKEVLMRLHSNGNAFIPFGNKDHAMLLGLHVTKDGIEARIYNSGEGLTLHHDSIGIKKKRKYQTCKTMLFEDMTPHTPKFKKILSTLVHAYTTCDTIDEVYALFADAEALPGSGLYQSPQKSENCELECIMAALLDMLGREDYDAFRRDLITTVLQKYAAEDRQDYVAGSPIRAETLARLKIMKDHRLHTDRIALPADIPPSLPFD